MTRPLAYVRTESVLVPAIACFVATVALYFQSDDGPGRGFTTERIVILAVAAVFLGGGVRSLMMRLVIGPDGVTVRNLFRTRRFALDDVLDVGEVAYRFSGLPAVALQLSTGRTCSITALQPPNRAFRRDDETAELIDDARRGLATAKGTAAKPFRHA